MPIRRAACAISRSHGPSVTACAAAAALQIKAAASSSVLYIGIMTVGELEAGSARLGLLLAAWLAALRTCPALGRALAAGLRRAALARCGRIGGRRGRDGRCDGRFVTDRADLRRIAVAAQHRGERVAILL